MPISVKSDCQRHQRKGRTGRRITPPPRQLTPDFLLTYCIASQHAQAACPVLLIHHGLAQSRAGTRQGPPDWWPHAVPPCTRSQQSYHYEELGAPAWTRMSLVHPYAWKGLLRSDAATAGSHTVPRCRGAPVPHSAGLSGLPAGCQRVLRGFTNRFHIMTTRAPY
jgi:hypothetical protein